MEKFPSAATLHSATKKDKQRFFVKNTAFSLAEVLLTLAVIGIIAALTIPSLEQTWRERQFVTAKNKAMTTIANGYRLMIADNADSVDKLPLFECGEDFACLSDVHSKYFQVNNEMSKKHDGLVEKYIKHDSYEDAGFTWDDVPYIFMSDDGMVYGYLARGNTFEVVVDVNGTNSPNKICKDVHFIKFNGHTIYDAQHQDNGEDIPFCEELDNSIKEDNTP